MLTLRSHHKTWHLMVILVVAFSATLQRASVTPETRAEEPTAAVLAQDISLRSSSVRSVRPERPHVMPVERRSEATGQPEAEVHRMAKEQVAREPSPLPSLPIARTVLSFPAAIQPDPNIQAMVTQVVSSTLVQYVGDLSGEWPVVIEGQPYTLTTRYTYSGMPIQNATRFVGEQLAAHGLDVEYHQWSGPAYPNVIGEIRGMVNPDEIYLLSAHLDSFSNDPANDAPGADDNGSGSAAVLLAAEILSQYRWGCTLRFALWTGEEQGLRGSSAYALRSAGLQENIAGVINLDMIGYDSDGLPVNDLHARSSLPGSVAMANLFAGVIIAYQIKLQPEVFIDQSIGNRSDNRAFWDQGYAALLAIEDYDDFNPDYHQTRDRLQNLDLDYYTAMVQAALGSFSHMSRCLIDDGLGYLEGHVTEGRNGSPVPSAMVSVESAERPTLTTYTDATGYYSSTLYAGTYTMTVSAPILVRGIPTPTTVVSGTVTTQDFVLAWPPYVYYMPLSPKEN